MKITGRVWIGEDVFLENTYPECIELHDKYGGNLHSVLLAHWRGSGKIIVERNARIGACWLVTAAPGEIIVVGEGSMVAAGSVVTKSVASYTLVGRRVGQAHRKPEIRAIEGRFIQTIQVGNHAPHAFQVSGRWCFGRGTMKSSGNDWASGGGLIHAATRPMLIEPRPLIDSSDGCGCRHESSP